MSVILNLPNTHTSDKRYHVKTMSLLTFNDTNRDVDLIKISFHLSASDRCILSLIISVDRSRH